VTVGRCKRKPQPDADQRYVCVQSFVTETGAVAEGTWLQGSDALVRAHPRFFLPASAGDDELASARQGALYPDLDQEPPGADFSSTHIGTPLADGDAVVCVRAVAQKRGPASGVPSSLRLINVGDRVAKDDPVVAANPDHFAPVS